MMRDSFVPSDEVDAPTAFEQASSQDLDRDSSRNTGNLSDLTRVVVEQVLASFTKPLNVVPISLHLVKTLEHFPVSPAASDKETQL
jgi:hypothetical protein